MNRSSRAEVRNPVLALPAMARLRALSSSENKAVEGVLRDLAVAAAERAERAWKKNKGPMAAYWKAVGVYAKHTARALKGVA